MAGRQEAFTLRIFKRGTASADGSGQPPPYKQDSSRMRAVWHPAKPRNTKTRPHALGQTRPSSPVKRGQQRTRLGVVHVALGRNRGPQQGV